VKFSIAAVLVLLAAPAMAESQSISSMVDHYAAKHGVPGGIGHGVVRVESRYNPKARNGIHHGLMQISVHTARALGCGRNLFDPHVNLDCGMRYLRLAIERGGAGCAGISLYNTGVGAPVRCRGYGRKVLALGK
jgi:soluble lytic murein transglycosylase-like protein